MHLTLGFGFLDRSGHVSTPIELGGEEAPAGAGNRTQTLKVQQRLKDPIDYPSSVPQ